MQIHYADVEHVLRLARLYYKRRLKSANKIYIGAINHRTGQRDPKRPRRNFETAIAREKIDDLRDMHFGANSYAGYGEKLYWRNIRYGNCGEMASIAAFLCRCYLASKYAQMKVAWPQSPQSGPDHMFVVLRDRDAPARDFDTIEEMADDPVDGYWVIDCWMNIACRAEAYLTFARMHAAKWALERKMIVTGSPTGTIHVTAPAFVATVSRAPIEWYDG